MSASSFVFWGVEMLRIRGIGFIAKKFQCSQPRYRGAVARPQASLAAGKQAHIQGLVFRCLGFRV